MNALSDLKRYAVNRMGNVVKISTPSVTTETTENGYSTPQFEGLPTAEPALTPAMMTAKAQAVSDCMLEQYMGTAVGVGVGLALGLQRRNVRPFILAITFGTFGDWISGYYGPCRPAIEDFQRARSTFEQTNEPLSAKVSLDLLGKLQQKEESDKNDEAGKK